MQTLRGTRFAILISHQEKFINLAFFFLLQLDYISRLMWQAQLMGRKTWKLVPPPECDSVCSKMSVTVEAGDIGKYQLYSQEIV